MKSNGVLEVISDGYGFLRLSLIHIYLCTKKIKMASQIPYLDVQNLTKRFGAQVLFDNISFSIAEGQKLSLIHIFAEMALQLAERHLVGCRVGRGDEISYGFCLREVHLAVEIGTTGVFARFCLATSDVYKRQVLYHRPSLSKTLGNLALICQKWSLILLLLKSGGTVSYTHLHSMPSHNVLLLS